MAVGTDHRVFIRLSLSPLFEGTSLGLHGSLLDRGLHHSHVESLSDLEGGLWGELVGKQQGGLYRDFLLLITDITTILSDMKRTSDPSLLESEIASLQSQLLNVGPMHPGSISRQYHVCGNPNCRCMHPTQPQRHGPYSKLAYVHRGKHVCRFVRAACVDDVQKRLDAYKVFRSLMNRWIQLSIQRATLEFFSTPNTQKSSRRSPKKPTR